jgi:hypothetical protein
MASLAGFLSSSDSAPLILLLSLYETNLTKFTTKFSPARPSKTKFRIRFTWHPPPPPKRCSMFNRIQTGVLMTVLNTSAVTCEYFSCKYCCVWSWYCHHYEEATNFNCIQLAKFVSTAGLLKMPAFWHVTLRRWISFPMFVTWEHRAAARGSSLLKERYDVTRIIGNVVLVNSGFHTQKNFLENYLQFGHALSKTFVNSVRGPTRLKTKRAPRYEPAWSVHMSRAGPFAKDLVPFASRVQGSNFISGAQHHIRMA